MIEYGQIVDDFMTPEGRFLVIWDLSVGKSWRALVPSSFVAEVGSVVAFEFGENREKGRLGVIEAAKLPAPLKPVIDPPGNSRRSHGGGADWTDMSTVMSAAV